MLTENEHRAMDLTADLANLLGRIVGTGPTRDADLGELVALIHGLQTRILAQAAAREYPAQYRLLGQTLR